MFMYIQFLKHVIVFSSSWSEQRPNFKRVFYRLMFTLCVAARIAVRIRQSKDALSGRCGQEGQRGVEAASIDSILMSFSIEKRQQPQTFTVRYTWFSQVPPTDTPISAPREQVAAIAAEIEVYSLVGVHCSLHSAHHIAWPSQVPALQ